MKDHQKDSEEMVTRFLSPYIGFKTTADKVLFGIATSLTLILFIILIRFWIRRKQVVHNIHEQKDADRNIKQIDQAATVPVEYPTISFIPKSRTASNGSIESEVSSMWDSQSQKFDNMFFKDTEIQIQIELSMKDIEADDEIRSKGIESETVETGVLETDLRSTVDRDDAKVIDTKINTWSLQRYVEKESREDDNILVAESRDDVMCESRSV